MGTINSELAYCKYTDILCSADVCVACLGYILYL